VLLGNQGPSYAICTSMAVVQNFEVMSKNFHVLGDLHEQKFYKKDGALNQPFIGFDDN